MRARDNFHFQSSPYKKDLVYASTNERFLLGKLILECKCLLGETISYPRLNVNSFSHLIRFPLNSCLRSSSEIQNNCGWLVSWWQNSGSLQGADLGEGVHGGMRARRLGKGLGTGGKRQQVLPSLLHPDLLTLASAQRYFRLLQESIFARRSQWEVIPFCSVYPFTPTATLSPTIPDYIW